MTNRSSVNQWLVGLLLLLLGMLSYRFLIENTGLFGSSTNSRTVTPRGDLAEDEKTTIDLFDKASPSVVSIKTQGIVTDQRRRQYSQVEVGQGSGVVWDKQGHIVTNYHVIANAIQLRGTSNDTPVFGSCKVILKDGSEWDAQIQSFAPVFDLAVLKLTKTPPSRLTPIAIGTSSDLLVGQNVFAIGSPFGLPQTLTKGIISGVRNLTSDSEGTNMDDMIQTDAAINPGNSGGPLLDSAGRMIGVNTLIYSPGTAATGIGQSAGIGFAVPIDTVNLIVPQLIEGGFGTRAGLGVTLISIPEIEGAVINRVGLGSAAAEAGLQRFDIVVAVDREPISSTADLTKALGEYEVGDKVTLTIVRGRGDRSISVSMTLQAILDVDSLGPLQTAGQQVGQ